MGLWRFEGPQIKNRLPEFVAVKEAKSGDLEDEVEFQMKLMQCKTEHILLPLQTPIKDQVDYDNNSDEKYMVILLEYCEMGDLKALIERRRTM